MLSIQLKRYYINHFTKYWAIENDGIDSSEIVTWRKNQVLRGASKTLDENEIIQQMYAHSISGKVCVVKRLKNSRVTSSALANVPTLNPVYLVFKQNNA